jgi:hypothetical protein
MDVHVEVNYLHDGPEAESSASLTDKLLDAQAVAEHNEAHRVLVRDGRAVELPRAGAIHALLDGCGYCLQEHVSAVTDWYNEKEVASTYHAEAREIVESILGPEAKVFQTGGHILRDEQPLVRDAALQAPARSVHNDFAPSYAKNFHQNEQVAAMLEAKRARLITVNLWRNISKDPMVRMPLALLDRRSIDPADLRAVPLERDGVGGGHEIMVANYNPRHQWAYFPNLSCDEVMVFLTFDSLPGDDFIPTM